MSVLIKGMEMPKSCDDCEFCQRDISGYDWCCIPMTNERSKPLDEPVLKPDWCPLVPIPPHGDLIDRDALMQHEVLLPMDGGHLPIVYASYVRNAPTIIPASEEAIQENGGQDEAPAGPYDLLYEEGGANTT